MKRAATLAVGTEITDGQIHDRNSGWISERLVEEGIQVIEHRAVADERDDIERALRELSTRVDILFVTGGLGPTSDDFTRDLIAKVFGRKLKFDEPSWQHLKNLLSARGITARDIQKQQCFFPSNARVITNPSGTANAFCLQSETGLTVYALPGPPSEIAAVWESQLGREISQLVPHNEREQLKILRFLGRGESQIAEIVEEIIRGQPVRVGYRAHLPYIEVKIWYRSPEANSVIDRVKSELKEWFINQGKEDVADSLIDYAISNPVRILDGASDGAIQERLTRRLKELNLRPKPMSISTQMGETGHTKIPFEGSSLNIDLSYTENDWLLKMHAPGKLSTAVSIKPAFNYNVRSERGLKYIAEKVFITVGDYLGSR